MAPPIPFLPSKKPNFTILAPPRLSHNTLHNPNDIPLHHLRRTPLPLITLNQSHDRNTELPRVQPLLRQPLAARYPPTLSPHPSQPPHNRPGSGGAWMLSFVGLAPSYLPGDEGWWGREYVEFTLVSTFISSITMLSIQPHQEPRFLIPLLVPFAALVGNSTFFGGVRKLFWTTWMISNILPTLAFAIFYRGHVILSVFHIRTLLDEYSDGSTDVRIVYWETYMPPWHLFVTGTDLAGASPFTLLTTLSPIQDAYLIALLDATPRNHVWYYNTRYPHSKRDHLDEVWEVGLRVGLTLGMFR
ncbi:hypothetical protein JAAARDRAFT_196116 [Jaapia argillacea MUCL 33604]|uniref:Mannosyltransferase n=1 Tax=Jaapia argillacea MUCL 33604 TaxID=933084 RepID=A0A067PKC0_9AGAM|nr:hypothetical protein JAAARDRAFT_196116 [Jaapia argillacea MUCL 33604]